MADDSTPDTSTPTVPAPVTDTLTAQHYDPGKRGELQIVVLPTGEDKPFVAGIVTH